MAPTTAPPIRTLPAEIKNEIHSMLLISEEPIELIIVTDEDENTQKVRLSSIIQSPRSC